MTVSLRWLHLSDLHCGLDSAGPLMPAAKEALFHDLERIHGAAGPFDFVVFTGDLTQRGSKREFDALTKYLKELWAHLETLQPGRRPYLLAVPGNHDLQRPKKRDNWLARAKGWPDGRTEYEKVIAKAFATYTAWWDRLDLPEPDGFHAGWLPGDFTATVQRDGLRLGVMGLNSSFLQLDGDKYKGALALELDQFHRACPGGDGVAWANQHHLCMLLTHHPPAWLRPASRRTLNEEILAVGGGRFALHLYGHMHVGEDDLRQPGLGEPLLSWQAEALFGLDGQDRRNGYAAFLLEADPFLGSAALRLWPRHAEPRRGGRPALGRDQRLDLVENDGGTRPVALPLHRPTAGRVRRLRSDPSLPQDPRYHIGHKSQETLLLDLLSKKNRACSVFGAAFSGKSTLLRSVRDGFLKQEPGARALYIDLADERRFPPGALESEDSAFLSIATAMAEEAGVPAQQLLHRWGRGGVRGDLTAVLDQLLSQGSEPLLLIFDDVDLISHSPYWIDLTAMLRGWCETRPRVRLLLATCAQHVFSQHGVGSPMLNILLQITVTDWGVGELSQLAIAYGLLDDIWSARDLVLLVRRGGLSPYVARLLMHHAAQHRWTLAETLARGRAPGGFLAQRQLELATLHPDSQSAYGAYRLSLEELCRER